MSKRAEERASIAAHGWQSDKEGNMTLEMFPEPFRRGFVKGYEQAQKDFIALVKQYLEKGERCMEQEGESQIYAFWDGFYNCAENILRELEEE